ncbi:helix-turn-helix transcriptional regulator [Yersinia sp. 2544 StPb PI]|uniref:S24 family peptidase n=1 Tax=Yersinia sp. 2544 StPb PI TaxID=3117409 RepID=UPI003B28405E
MVKKEDLNKQFSERLHAACLDAGVAGRGLPKRIQAALKKQSVKISEPGIWKWLNAAAIPDSTNILALSRWLGVRSEWLEYGRGSMREDSVIAPSLLAAIDTDQFYRVEVLDVQASAGDGYLVSSDFIETIRAIEYTNDQARVLFGNRPADMVKVITVKGDSMSGTIESGDQIFLDMAVNFFDGDGIYVFVFGQTLHVKRLQMVKNTLLVLSDNKNYKEWSIEEADEAHFFVMAKVLLKQSVDYKRF